MEIKIEEITLREKTLENLFEALFCFKYGYDYNEINSEVKDFVEQILNLKESKYD